MFSIDDIPAGSNFYPSDLLPDPHLSEIYTAIAQRLLTFLPLYRTDLFQRVDQLMIMRQLAIEPRVVLKVPIAGL
jgi:hypothetical protein